MSDFDISKKSRPVIITAYLAGWADEYLDLARQIRAHAGTAATRIDHIGSTAIPGIGAKDVIDLQITVPDLDDVAGLFPSLGAAGFRPQEEICYDLFRGMHETDRELRKFFIREPEGQRRAHIHVREQGRFNQRYALLFRDYLRSSDSVRDEYELLKRRAAELFPDSIDGYLFLKDPVLHIIYQAASLWQEKVGWTPDESWV